jgi:hypothetical protein
MRAVLSGFALMAAAGTWAADPVTVVEATSYGRTSLYAEVVDLIHSVAATSSYVTLATLAQSAEGRDVPLVILSKERVRTPAELRATGKPAVLVMANIHAGEVEGKEACQMLVRGVGSGRLAKLVEHQVVLVVPIFNADGNDKLGPNRHDEGPEVAGVRYNGQYLDLNRDYTKLESPEVRALVGLLNAWDPVLVLDMHTTNGSYHREPVTYTTGGHPNGPRVLADFMWGSLFPAVAATLRKTYGWDSVPYGSFADAEHPEKGWENDSLEARYGTNYVALRNRLAILDENYSYADFKTRVLSSHDFVKAVLEYTDTHAADLVALVRRADAETRDTFSQQPFATAWKLDRLMDVTVKGFEHTKLPVTPEERARYPWLGEFRMQPTEVQRDYTMPYMTLAVPTSTVSLPAGYVVLPGNDEAVRTLLAHGLAVEWLGQACKVSGERFMLQKVETAKDLYQGHALVTLAGRYEKAEMELPAGSAFVDMRQPLARLVPVLLEPTSGDSLAAWGFFNRALVRQWSAEPGVYPVLRLDARPPVPLIVMNAQEPPFPRR